MIITNSINSYYSLNISGLKYVYRHKDNDEIFLIFESTQQAKEFTKNLYSCALSNIEKISGIRPLKKDDIPLDLYRLNADMTVEGRSVEAYEDFENKCRGYGTFSSSGGKSLLSMANLLERLNFFSHKSTTPYCINLNERGMLPNVLANH